MIATPALGDPAANPGQPWHATQFTKAEFTGSGGRPLVYSPAQACFGAQGWIGADINASLFANQADPRRAHVRGSVSLTFWVRLDPSGGPPNSYEGHATLTVNGFVVASQFADQGYIEYPMRVDMVPLEGGSAVPMIFPIQIWVAWGATYTAVSWGSGIESCA